MTDNNPTEYKALVDGASSEIRKKALILEVVRILNGIDELKSERAAGWWETAAGAKFGYNKLEDVIIAIEDA